ncbi:MAG: asparagine synthase [Pseudonocardiales bacterium]|nr:asparagine synthase [Pseudonocardiales bacterium]
MLTTGRGDRRSRSGIRWWCALPDLDTATFAARLLATEADTVVAHGSGRPWLFGCGIADEFRIVVVGLTRVAVIGTCLATDLELRTHVESTVRRDNVDPLTTLPGSYHLVVSGPAGMLVFGDIVGFRRVFTTQTGATTVAASHAGVLRRLVNAPVSRTWLAARLASPEMPSLLRESLSPFEGVRVIPPGHCLTVHHDATRHTLCWAPPPAVEPLSDGARVLAEALTSAVAGRVRAAGRPISGPIAGPAVSVQLSGGLDSTAVSCLAGNAIWDRSVLLLVTTASISPGNDDLSWARQVADHLIPAEHLVLGAQETPCFFDDLPAVETEMDEPAPFTAAAARVRHLAAVLAGCGVRVHLNGQGGDEVLLAPLTYLHDALRAHPRQGWRHLRGQAALRDLNVLRLTRSMLATPSFGSGCVGPPAPCEPRRPPR